MHTLVRLGSCCDVPLLVGRPWHRPTAASISSTRNKDTVQQLWQAAPHRVQYAASLYQAWCNSWPRNSRAKEVLPDSSSVLPDGAGRPTCCCYVAGFQVGSICDHWWGRGGGATAVERGPAVVDMAAGAGTCGAVPASYPQPLACPPCCCMGGHVPHCSADRWGQHTAPAVQQTTQLAEVSACPPCASQGA
jgi:hypothetical protein